MSVSLFIQKVFYWAFSVSTSPYTQYREAVASKRKGGIVPSFQHWQEMGDREVKLEKGFGLAVAWTRRSVIWLISAKVL